jgi:hypothetical protein
MEEMGEELGDVTQLVGLQPMNGLVLLAKYLLKWSHILLVQHTETLQGGIIAMGYIIFS